MVLCEDIELIKPNKSLLYFSIEEINRLPNKAFVESLRVCISSVSEKLNKHELSPLLQKL